MRHGIQPATSITDNLETVAPTTMRLGLTAYETAYIRPILAHELAKAEAALNSAVGVGLIMLQRHVATLQGLLAKLDGFQKEYAMQRDKGLA